MLFIEFPGRNLVGYLALNKLLYGHWTKKKIKDQDAYSVIAGNQSTGQSAYLKQFYKNEQMASAIICLFYKGMFWFAIPIYNNFKENSLIALPYKLHFFGLFLRLQAHCKPEKVNVLCCLD